MSFSLSFFFVTVLFIVLFWPVEQGECLRSIAIARGGSCTFEDFCLGFEFYIFPSVLLIALCSIIEQRKVFERQSHNKGGPHGLFKKYIYFLL